MQIPCDLEKRHERPSMGHARGRDGASCFARTLGRTFGDELGEQRQPGGGEELCEAANEKRLLR